MDPLPTTPESERIAASSPADTVSSGAPETVAVKGKWPSEDQLNSLDDTVRAALALYATKVAFRPLYHRSPQQDIVKDLADSLNQLERVVLGAEPPSDAIVQRASRAIRNTKGLKSDERPIAAGIYNVALAVRDLGKPMQGTWVITAINNAGSVVAPRGEEDRREFWQAVQEWADRLRATPPSPPLLVQLLAEADLHITTAEEQTVGRQTDETLAVGLDKDGNVFGDDHEQVELNGDATISDRLFQPSGSTANRDDGTINTAIPTLPVPPPEEPISPAPAQSLPPPLASAPNALSDLLAIARDPASYLSQRLEELETSYGGDPSAITVETTAIREAIAHLTNADKKGKSPLPFSSGDAEANRTGAAVLCNWNVWGATPRSSATTRPRLPSLSRFPGWSAWLWFRPKQCARLCEGKRPRATTGGAAAIR